MDRNLALYPWYRAASNTLAWLPVFFLYFFSRVPLDEAIRLGAIYYLAVVLFEVPSGYLSDRAGRRPVLLLAAAAAVAANALFIVADGFTALAAAQVLLAASIAFQSGSDTALHYDTLARLGLEHEYAAREARSERYGLTALALSCLLGGAAGLYDLRLAYLLSLLGALAALLLALRLCEPPSRPRAQAAGRQLYACVADLGHPALAWLFAFTVLNYLLQHVAYEFYQPYIRLLGADAVPAIAAAASGGDAAPLASGIIIATSMFGGALGALFSIPLYRRLGLATLLFAGALLQCLTVAGLAALLHPALLLLVMLRNFPMGLAHGPLRAAIAPRVPAARLATYLSLQSLASRLFFSALLYALASAAGDDLDWPTLSALLLSCAGGGVLGIALLALTLPATLRAGAPAPPGPIDARSRD